jgi:hypothetical protein
LPVTSSGSVPYSSTIAILNCRFQNLIFTRRVVSFRRLGARVCLDSLDFAIRISSNHNRCCGECPHDHKDAGISRTGDMEYRPGSDQPYPSLILAARITLPHFSVSSAMSLPKSVAEPESVIPPRSANRAFILGSARPALISLLSLLMISAGVVLGAPIPYQELARDEIARLQAWGVHKWRKMTTLIRKPM